MSDAPVNETDSDATVPSAPPSAPRPPAVNSRPREWYLWYVGPVVLVVGLIFLVLAVAWVSGQGAILETYLRHL